MQSKDILAIKLRDDLFLNMLAKSQEDIRNIWKNQIGEDPYADDPDDSDDISYGKQNEIERKKNDLEKKLQ